MRKESEERRSVGTSIAVSANTIKTADSTTQKKCVENICSGEYVDNRDAKKDILGTADIGPARKKGAREANLASGFQKIL